MPGSPNSPGGLSPATGSNRPMTKAERLFAMTFPYGPEFPLDGDIIAELEDYPGEMPTSPEHFVDLLPDPRSKKGVMKGSSALHTTVGCRQPRRTIHATKRSTT